VHLRHALCTLALHGQDPAAPTCPKSDKDWEPLGRRQSQEGLRVRLDRCHVAATVMQKSYVLSAPWADSSHL